MTDVAAKETVQKRMSEIAISLDALASGIAFAIEQPENVEVDSIVIRPTAQD